MVSTQPAYEQAIEISMATCGQYFIIGIITGILIFYLIRLAISQYKEDIEDESK